MKIASILFAKRTSCRDVYSMQERSIFAPAASESPSRIPSFRTPIPFLPRSDARVRSIFHLAPVYHSKRSYLPETRRPTSVGGRVMRYRLVEKRFVLPNGTSTVLRFEVITLDFKRFNSICRINLEERLKCEITHYIKNRCFFNNAFK